MCMFPAVLHFLAAPRPPPVSGDVFLAGELPRGEVDDDWVVGDGPDRRRSRLVVVLARDQLLQTVRVAVGPHRVLSCDVRGEVAVGCFGSMAGDDVACVHNKMVVDAIGTRMMQRVGSRRRELGNSRDRQDPFTSLLDLVPPPSP